MAIKIGFVSELGVDSELVRDFYYKNWQRKIALSDKDFYNWQFIKAPASNTKDHCVIAYDSNKNIILGAMGLHERKFYLDGLAKKGAELTTWVVASEARGTGAGTKILQYIQMNFEVLVGMGISEMALPIYMRSGFRYLKEIPRFIKVLNFEKIKGFSEYTPLGLKLIKEWSKEIEIDYQATEVNENEYKYLFDQVKDRYNLFSRCNNNRRWRYEIHPYFKYKQFIIKQENEKDGGYAYISIREEKSISKFKVIHVMDLFGADRAISAAVKFINNYGKKEGFDVIDFYCTSSSIYRFMISDGWFSISDDNCFQFPHLFHPVEIRNPPTTSLIYWSKNGLENLADISKLYITKQDADLDRPTIHTIEDN